MDRESFRHLLLEGLGGEWPTGTDLEIQVSKVIDADGLFLVTHDLDLIRGQKNVVLTPNIIEFKRFNL